MSSSATLTSVGHRIASSRSWALWVAIASPAGETRPPTADRDSPARSAGASRTRSGPIGVARRREEPERQGSERRVAAEPDSHVAPRCVQRQHVRVRARERAAPGAGAHPLRVRERQLLSDHAAHRHADHVGAVDAERLHEPERVRRHHRGRVGVIGRARSRPAPRLSKRDHAIAARGAAAGLERPRRGGHRRTP
mgnify:CR=1 FL=1